MFLFIESYRKPICCAKNLLVFFFLGTARTSVTFPYFVKKRGGGVGGCKNHTNAIRLFRTLPGITALENLANQSFDRRCKVCAFVCACGCVMGVRGSDLSGGGGIKRGGFPS